MRRGRFHRFGDNKRYFLTQKMMRENRWEQAVYQSILNRGEDNRDVLGVTAGTHPCGCGCGGTCKAVFENKPYDYRRELKNIKNKRLVTFEMNGREVPP